MHRNGVGSDFSLAQFARDNMYPAQKTGVGYLVFCPFHNDTKKPSMYVTDILAYCFSCGKSYSASTLVERVKNIGKEQAKEYVFGVTEKKKKADLPKRAVDPPSMAAVETASRMLQGNRVALRYLVEKRGIDSVTLRKYNIGMAVPPFGRYKVARITFPAFDEFGVLKTISYRMCPGLDYKKDKSDDLRYITHCATSLFPFNIAATRQSKDIVYAGGQIDCLTLLSFGVPSVGSMGEGVFKPEWARYFGDNRVFILLDNDKAGYAGAIKMSKLLPNSKIVFWPKDTPEKCDINSAALDKSFGIERIIGMLYGMGFGGS